MLNEIRRMGEEMEKIAPNMHAAEHLDEVLEKLEGTNESFNLSRDHAQEIRQKFESVKAER